MAAIRYGADWSKATPTAAMLAKHGITFACRYLLDPARDRGKRLTLAEAQRLTALGVDLVANFEYATQPVLTYAQGQLDGRTAAAELAALGAPAGVPVYFSFDYDAPNSHFPGMFDYLRGAASVLGAGRVGAYGKYAVIEYLASRGVTWLWQTYAWSGGLWSAHATIRQIRNGAFPGEFDGDLDQAMVPDFGQWNYSTQGDDVSFAENLTPLGDLAAFLPADLHVTKDTVWSADRAIKLAVVAGQAARTTANDAKTLAKAAADSAAAAASTAAACRDAIGALVTSEGDGTGGAPIDLDALVAKLAPAVADLLAARLAN
jgi:hypothetical protein